MGLKYYRQIMMLELLVLYIYDVCFLFFFILFPKYCRVTLGQLFYKMLWDPRILDVLGIQNSIVATDALLITIVNIMFSVLF